MASTRERAASYSDGGSDALLDVTDDSDVEAPAGSLFAAEGRRSGEPRRRRRKRKAQTSSCTWRRAACACLCVGLLGVCGGGGFLYWRYTELADDDSVPWDSMSPAWKQSTCPYDPVAGSGVDGSHDGGSEGDGGDGGGASMYPAHRVGSGSGSDGAGLGSDASDGSVTGAGGGGVGARAPAVALPPSVGGVVDEAAAARGASVTPTLPPPVPTCAGPDFVSLCWAANTSLKLDYFAVVGDDWWDNSSALSRPLCRTSGGNTTCTVRGLLPATRVNLRLLAWRDTPPAKQNASNADAESAVGAATTGTAGGCGNAADMRAWRAAKATAKPAIQKCLVDCALNKDPQACAGACITKAIGVSAPCAACWVAEGDCTLSHCVFPCISPGSAACKACSRQHCFPACVECTGIPEWAFPP
uniref:Uncharacterized protein n=1 Tax=Bicosoecida sp. CB-2014 TaxID=1486930 RepID=A0A7S1C2F5_9STRA